ncbi:phytanoyl-CoA dioxygenase family protein [Cellvibrio sp. ARAG 10.3]|uniref:phytanoyl-CoA dioxygenase family protein n=1 Tax=Cellvibrio sp. ARAG 10.3 TaxID=3451358 RepID=UPI003F4460D1
MFLPDDMYPSRTGADEQVIPRKDPVVYPNPSLSEKPLAKDSLDFYADNGFLVLPDYLPEQVEPLLAEIESLKKNMVGEEALVSEPGSREVRTIFKPFQYSDVIRNFFRDPKILDVARQLLGSDVYMMQSRVNIKPAYTGRSFAWHSDFETWHVEDGMPRMRAVTAWIMLTENHEHNGPLYVIPGSHQLYVSCAGQTGAENYKTSLKAQKLGVPQPDTMNEILATRDIKAITGKPGTVVFHECNILHGSPDNISNDPRTILMCVYNSVLNKPVAPFGGLEPRPDFLSNRDQRPITSLAV